MTVQNKESEEAKQLRGESEKMEKLLNKKSILLQKRDELERKIREIGSLPTTEVESFKAIKDLKELMKRLHTTNQELKGFSNINKKAGDQYVHFSEQRSKLFERKKELDEGADVSHPYIPI